MSTTAKTKTTWPKLIVGHTYRFELFCVESGQRVEGGTWTVDDKQWSTHAAGAFRAYVLRCTRQGRSRAVVTDITEVGAMIRYRRVNEDTYDATDGIHTVQVQKGWERGGGWQWVVLAVPDGRWHVKAASRKAAAERALRIVRRDSNPSTELRATSKPGLLAP